MGRQLRQTRPPDVRHLIWSVLFPALLISPLSSQGSTWRGGAGLGLGGQGIKKQTTTVEDSLTTVERSESPLTGQIYLDRLILPNWTLGIEHSRGFRMGPFSSGIGFTSGIVRWYYLAPPPEPSRQLKSLSTFFQRRWSPYGGFSTGVAFGQVVREADLVPSVSESGVHIGFRGGADYLYKPSMGLRAEVTFQTTLFQNQVRPGYLQEFSLWAGFFVPLF